MSRIDDRVNLSLPVGGFANIALAGLARHASLDLSELALAGQQLLSLLGDLALHLELDLAQLLLLAAELLLLQADRLGGKILGVHRRVDAAV
jgi:hypothetical protein